jgi:hypothetical protein
VAYPASFNESNGVLGCPQGLTEEQFSPLSICRGRIGELPVVISCWRLTPEELAEINRSGRVWLKTLGTNMAPTSVHGVSPMNDVEWED